MKEMKPPPAGMGEPLKCERCGYSHPAVLHLIHPKGEKGADNLIIVNGRFMKASLPNIKKSTLLCLNCYCIKHYEAKPGGRLRA
jgi:hypothetical protein